MSQKFERIGSDSFQIPVAERALSEYISNVVMGIDVREGNFLSLNMRAKEMMFNVNMVDMAME